MRNYLSCKEKFQGLNKLNELLRKSVKDLKLLLQQKLFGQLLIHSKTKI